MLDGEASKPIRIKQDAIKARFAPLPGPGEAAITVIYELDFKPVESKLTGEKAGDTSQFTATHDQLENLKQMKFTVDALTLKGQNLKQITFDYPKGNEGE